MKFAVALLVVCYFYSTEACKDTLHPSICADVKTVGTCGVYKDLCQKTCGNCGGVLPPTRRPIFPTRGPGPGPKTPPPIVPTGECGVSSFAGGRVIAGTTAREGAWPWQILLKSNGRPGCGGSLISANWVLTAAHCMNGGSYTVVLGEHDRNGRSGNEQEIRVSSAITHPQWNRRTFEYDYALLRLSRPAQLNRYVKPVCLPSGDPAPGTSCYITGWGKTSSRGQMNALLQQAPMRVIEQNTCHKKNYAAIRVAVRPSMICGGGAGRISGCQGDSGGPFVCNEGGRFVLHGDVSHGSRECRSSETYTVFGRVNYVRGWIRSTANV